MDQVIDASDVNVDWLPLHSLPSDILAAAKTQGFTHCSLGGTRPFRIESCIEYQRMWERICKQPRCQWRIKHVFPNEVCVEPDGFVLGFQGYITLYRKVPEGAIV